MSKTVIMTEYLRIRRARVVWTTNIRDSRHRRKMLEFVMPIEITDGGGDTRSMRVGDRTF
jgi:hypothetical protein